MVSPRPWQVGQVRSMEKKPCWARTRPWPPQVAQVFGLEPFGAGAGAGLAGDGGRHLQRRRLALVGLLEGDFDIVAQVRAALAGAPRRRRAGPHVAEQVFEDVGHRGGEAVAEARRRRRHSRRPHGRNGHRRRASADRTGLVGLVEFLELRLGVDVAGIPVRMVCMAALRKAIFSSTSVTVRQRREFRSSRVWTWVSR